MNKDSEFKRMLGNMGIPKQVQAQILEFHRSEIVRNNQKMIDLLRPSRTRHTKGPIDTEQV